MVVIKQSELRKSRDLTRPMKWALKLSEFNIINEHHSGTGNVIEGVYTS